MITVEATGTLMPWTEWKHVMHPLRAEPMGMWTRKCALMFGALQAAAIWETSMRSGVRQYTVDYIGHEVPKPKFDSFQQALDYLKELIP